MLYTHGTGYTPYLFIYKQPPKFSLHRVLRAISHDELVEKGDVQVAEQMEFWGNLCAEVKEQLCIMTKKYLKSTYMVRG